MGLNYRFLVMFSEDGQTKENFLSIFPENTFLSKTLFFVMFPEGSVTNQEALFCIYQYFPIVHAQTRKHGFLVTFDEEGQTR